MATSVWKGMLTFGLVTIPIRLYAAARTKHTALHQLHKECNSRVRQPLFCPTCNRSIERSEVTKGYEFEKDQYVLIEDANAKVTLLASGSEVSIAMEAAAKLKADGIVARVVSFPSWELFEKQPQAYRDQVLGKVKRVAIEAGIRQGWDHYIGSEGLFCGMNRFGASMTTASGSAAPNAKLSAELGGGRRTSARGHTYAVGSVFGTVAT